MQTFDSDKVSEQFEDLYRAARLTIEELLRQIDNQRRHIVELEKQLEHLEPGLVQEVRESLEEEDK